MSDALKELASTAVINALISPIKDLMNDVKEITNGYQVPEHIVHAILLTAAMIAGSILPFQDAAYGDWMGGIIESLGFSGGLKSFSTWALSTWLISYPTSAVVNWGNRLARKCITGDLDFRMSAEKCLEIANELQIIAEENNMPEVQRTSTQVRDLFNTCLRYLRKPPGIRGAKSEDYAAVLYTLLHGDPVTAVCDLEELLKSVDEARQKLQARMQRIKPITPAAGVAEAAPQPAIEAARQPAANGVPAAGHNQTPAGLIKDVVYITHELTGEGPGTDRKEQATGADANSLVIKVESADDDALSAAASAQAGIELARPPQSVMLQAGGQSAADRRGSGASKGSSRGSSRNGSLRKTQAALMARIAQLNAAIPTSAHRYSSAHPNEHVDPNARVELILAARELRWQILILRQQRNTLPAGSNIERIYQAHCDALDAKNNADLTKIIEQDKVTLASIAERAGAPILPLLTSQSGEPLTTAAAAAPPARQRQPAAARAAAAP